MSVKDVIKSSVYESLGGGTGISFSDIVLIFVAAGLIGLYIFLIYRLISKAAFYSKDLNITIAGLVVIVAAIMIAMQSNLIVSLGMVGALSIVRFRNAVKNPLDLLFLFWAVGVGILCGVGLTILAVATSVVMTGLLWILEWIPNNSVSAVLLLKSGEEDTDWDAVRAVVQEYTKRCKEKSRNISKLGTEIIFEVKCSKEDELVQKLKEMKGLERISYLKYDGELRT